MLLCCTRFLVLMWCSFTVNLLVVPRGAPPQYMRRPSQDRGVKFLRQIFFIPLGKLAGRAIYFLKYILRSNLQILCILTAIKSLIYWLLSDCFGVVCPPVKIVQIRWVVLPACQNVVRLKPFDTPRPMAWSLVVTLETAEKS